MDQYIIMGAFGFLGYGICKRILEKGMQVYAISLENEDVDSFTDEKRMEIGRNANLYEISLEQWLKEEKCNQGITPIIIPIYDLFMEETDMLVLKNEFFLNRLRQLPPKHYPITLLLSEQQAFERGSNDEVVIQFKHFLDKNLFTYQEIYLPTLFGPWQPNEYLFQQLMFPQKHEGDLLPLNLRESQRDAVYIDDAANVVLQLLEKGEGKHLIRSGVTNNWLVGLKLLATDRPVCGSVQSEEHQQFICSQKSGLEPLNDEKFQRVLLEKPMDIRTGLSKQREQYERWLRSRT